MRIFSDSELVIRQLTGVYKVRKKHLADLHREVMGLVRSFQGVTYQSVSREDPFIRVADQLCNQTLDRNRVT